MQIETQGVLVALVGYAKRLKSYRPALPGGRGIAKQCIQRFYTDRELAHRCKSPSFLLIEKSPQTFIES